MFGTSRVSEALRLAAGVPDKVLRTWLVMGVDMIAGRNQVNEWKGRWEEDKFQPDPVIQFKASYKFRKYNRDLGRRRPPGRPLRGLGSYDGLTWGFGGG